MQRDAINELINWKNSQDRKPLILQGARQVGKTWLMKKFALDEYKDYIYITFDRNDFMKELFSGDINIPKIIEALELKTGKKIRSSKTLIILDEIQECPEALTTLKYFFEQTPQYHIIVAGSLLGVSLSGSGFPVGKVDFMTLYPLNFGEFLDAMGQNKLRRLLKNRDLELLKPFLEDIKYLLKQYYYIGGMPEVVNSFIKYGDYKKVRNLQENILISYEQDFSKHTSTTMAERIRGLWNSISSQLSRENSKFIYGAIKEGAKAREYKQAINWLRDSGLIYKISKITKPYMPIKAYEDLSSFKIFLLDVGLLGAMSNLSAKTILEEDKIFREFKGALAEQYVLQQIKRQNLPIYYWGSERKAEIDFVVQYDDIVVPIEVKSKTNKKAKSLALYRKEYTPQKSVRTSLSNFKIDEDLYNIPLYMIGNIENIISASMEPSQLSLFNFNQV